MDLFSIRNGYTKTPDMKIREKLTTEMKNSLVNTFHDLKYQMSRTKKSNGYQIPDIYEEHLWLNFLNLKSEDYLNTKLLKHVDVTKYIIEGNNPWHKVFDLIEYTISYLNNNISENYIVEWFISQLNREFIRLNYAYQISNNRIVEVE